MGLGRLNPGCCYSNCGNCYGTIEYINCILSWSTTRVNSSSGVPYAVRLIINGEIVSQNSSGQMYLPTSGSTRFVELQVACESGDAFETISTLTVDPTTQCNGAGQQCCQLGQFVQMLLVGEPWSAFSGLYQWTRTFGCSRILTYNLFTGTDSLSDGGPSCSQIVSLGTYIGRIAGLDTIGYPLSIVMNPAGTSTHHRLNFSLGLAIAQKAPSQTSYSCFINSSYSIAYQNLPNCQFGYCADDYPCSFPFYRPVNYVFRYFNGVAGIYSAGPMGSDTLSLFEMAMGNY